MVVLLSDAEQRSELRMNAGLLKDFTNCSSTWERFIKIYKNIYIYIYTYVCGGIQEILTQGIYLCSLVRITADCFLVVGEKGKYIYFL